MLWGVIGLWLAVLTVVTCRVARAPVTSGAAASGRRETALCPGPPWTLVRVCGGIEPHLLRNLPALPAGPPPAGVVLVVPDDDPQLATVLTARAILQGRGVPAVVCTTRVAGPNHKVAQLAAAAAHQAHGHVLVFADGDVDLSDYPLAALLEPLAHPTVGAVWAACFEGFEAGRASAAVLSTSLHCFALLGRLDPGGMVGKLWAVRGATLAQVGGWASLVDTLGEDMELARRLRAFDLQAVPARAAARTRPVHRGLRAAVLRYARWFWVIRAQRPHLLPSYPVLFFGTTNVLALCLWQALAAPAPALAVAGYAIGLRGVVGAVARRALGVGYRGLIWDCVLAEITIMAAFFCTLTRSTVTWRRQRLRVLRGGRIVPGVQT